MGVINVRREPNEGGDGEVVSPAHPFPVSIEDARAVTRAAPYSPVGYESLTIAATALSLAATSLNARSFVGRLETAQVRMRSDGTAPTTTEGELLEIGDIVILSAFEIEHMQFIRTGGTSGVLRGHFYDTEAATFS